jgi:glycerophosphoryl diester phosphodiesterase
MVKNIIISCLLAFGLNSCEKEEFMIANLNDNKITALGHGGMGKNSLSPMNSFESISRCLNFDIDGVEFDLQMTKDSVLVLYHDEDLSTKTNLSGLVNSSTWSELQKAHYTQKAYLSYSIISLDQLFTHTKNIQEYTFTLDCKLYTKNNKSQFYTSYAEALVEIIQKYDLMHNVTIESTDGAFLKLLKESGSDYKLFIYPDFFENGLDIAIDLNLFGITSSIENVTKRQIEIAHENNIRVALFGTSSRSAHIKAIEMNPDYLQTDNVPGLIKLLN